MEDQNGVAERWAESAREAKQAIQQHNTAVRSIQDDGEGACLEMQKRNKLLASLALSLSVSLSVSLSLCLSTPTTLN